MKYKALFIDVDGTLVPNGYMDVPSQKVSEAIAKARQKGIHVGIVTGRHLEILDPIFNHLSLEGPSIIVNGAQIIDSQTKKILWQQPIMQEDIEKVIPIIKKFATRIYINDDNIDDLYSAKKKYTNPLIIFIDSLPKEKADSLVAALTHIPTIAVGKFISYRDGQEDVWVSHVSATKAHGIVKAAEILGITPQEIIGVGDGYNDFSLLMASGLKIAMGNAIPDLKAVADCIAPTVEKDGVAWVIEKFILH